MNKKHKVQTEQKMTAKDGSVIHDVSQDLVNANIAHTGSGNINVFASEDLFASLKNIAQATQQETEEKEKQESAKVEPPRTSGWRIETPTIATGSIIEFFPGTVYESSIRQFHAGGYQIILQYSRPGDRNPQITMLKDGKPVDPIVDSDERIIRFPKRTVWLTGDFVIPLDGGRPEKGTWMVELPGRPLSQRAIQEYGLLKKVYIAQEFILEGNYRIVTAFNPSNPPETPIEVYFYHQDEQVQPIINHDTRTVSFPSK